MVNGILIVDKPRDFTSHDVVAKLRGMLRQKKIGHAGTLDPMATGVLVVLLGNATRASDHASGQSKEYIARLRLGQITDTQDVTGTVLEEHPVEVTKDDLKVALAAFTGDIQQLPPMYSAISVNGKRLYDLARKGVEVERASREITIEKLELLEGGENLGQHEYDLRAACSKGTYVRTICHDIGAALGCGGTMADLRRVRSGRFTLENALTFEEIAALLAENNLESRVFPTDSVFFDLPEVHLNAEGDIRASHGNFFTEKHLTEGAIPEEGGRCRIYDSTGRFCQIGESRQLDKGGLAIFCKINFGNKE